MSDRIAVMDEGNILQVSPPREIYHNPKNKFVSQFIGNINILDADLKNVSNESISISVDGFGLMTLKNHQKIIKGDRFNIAIRPEEINISKVSDTNHDCNFNGKVKNISFYGESTYFYIQLDNSEKILMVSTNESKETFSESDNCFVNFNSQNLKIIKD